MRRWSEDELKKNACIIVDEAQFLTKEEVLYLVHLVDDCSIPVICYGLPAPISRAICSPAATSCSSWPTS